MKNSKHTQGPWRARGDIVVAHRPHAVTSTINEESVLALTRPAEERHANARLIAAAPELLEALRAVLDNAPDDITGPVACDAYAAARALLAKVDGHE